ncbi:alpha/beta hydrolase [Brachybacterium phenoliresistens]|uniref:Alpha/beta hydrolase n=1 Tax=Brachybacterium phenoliresistens TaxID=396014 RepID=Z9JY35_9MICO|nr:alpha/beta fold hydrolase [Brachybacterium phenoliresistens]EWS83039.1 alpha/beta hydrolase [Brachybacterium phenoliresistens]
MTSRTPHRIVLVHGYGATPQDHWFPWLSRLGTPVDAPALPDPTAPRAEEWISRAAAAIGRTDARTVVVTHSLGGITALQALARLLRDGRAREPLAGFLAVAPFVDPLPAVGDPQLDAFPDRGLGRFLEGFAPEAIRELLGPVTVLRSDDDAIVPAAHSDRTAEALRAETVIVPGAGHFLAEDGVRELPALGARLGTLLGG